MMLRERHASVQIILVNQLQNCGEDTGIASRHLVDVISVPHDQNLKQRKIPLHGNTCSYCNVQDISRFHIYRSVRDNNKYSCIMIMIALVIWPYKLQTL